MNNIKSLRDKINPEWQTDWFAADRKEVFENHSRGEIMIAFQLMIQYLQELEEESSKGRFWFLNPFKLAILRLRKIINDDWGTIIRGGKGELSQEERKAVVDNIRQSSIRETHGE